MYFTDSQIAQIRENAFKILETVGVKVPRDDVRAKLSALPGFLIAGEWVRIDRKRAREHMEAQPHYTPRKPGKEIGCSLSAYAHTYETIDKKLEKITRESNAAMAIFCQNTAPLYPYFHPSAPGHPQDVTDYKQFFYQTANSMLYCKDADGAEPMDARIAEYCFDAADIVGRPRGGVSIYVASPLMIAGESFDIALKYGKRAGHIHVTCMPCLGANTPINLVAAYAQSLAETLAGAIIAQEMTGAPATFFAQLFPMDYRDMTMAFGTPEKLVLEWMNNEVSARLNGDIPSDGATDIHVMPHRAGEQPLMEKAMLAMAGAMRGVRYFHTVGSMGMDESFSPVEMLMDLDMLGSVQRVIEGLPVSDFEGDIIETVREGLKSGYMNSDDTLDNMADFVHYPRLMTRKSFGALTEKHVPLMREKAEDMARDLMMKPISWELAGEQRRELDRLIARVDAL